MARSLECFPTITIGSYSCFYLYMCTYINIRGFFLLFSLLWRPSLHLSLKQITFQAVCKCFLRRGTVHDLQYRQSHLSQERSNNVFEYRPASFLSGESTSVCVESSAFLRPLTATYAELQIMYMQKKKISSSSGKNVLSEVSFKRFSLWDGDSNYRNYTN